MNENASPVLVARTVYYSGRVQGVGFRATVAHVARSFAVTGWVRNLSDGRVQLFAEGVEGELARFLEAVRQRWQGYVQHEDIEPRQPTGKLNRFQIVL